MWEIKHTESDFQAKEFWVYSVNSRDLKDFEQETAVIKIDFSVLWQSIWCWTSLLTPNNQRSGEYLWKKILSDFG